MIGSIGTFFSIWNKFSRIFSNGIFTENFQKLLNILCSTSVRKPQNSKGELHTVTMLTDNIFRVMFGAQKYIKEQLYTPKLSKVLNLQYPGFSWSFSNLGEIIFIIKNNAVL